jgi:hypothetical protein
MRQVFVCTTTLDAAREGNTVSLDNVRQFQRTAFSIMRYSDKTLVEKLNALVKEGGYKVERSQYYFTFADQSAEFTGDESDERLEQLLAINTITTRQIVFYLSGCLQVSIERNWDNQSRKLKDNQDLVALTPIGNQNPNLSIINFAKAIALARRHFDAVDAKPFMDSLEQGAKELYQSREQDLQKLERMQETFFKGMTEFTLDQQKEQREFQRKMEADYAGRQTRLEEQHQQRLKEFEDKEAQLKIKLLEIDERANQQARRDIYQEIKKKLDERNTKFELTTGTQGRRRITFGFTLALLALFLAGFCYCFYRNVVNGGADINWPAVGSQIGFALGFIAFATFFIRWNNQWFQRHADEEFKLKRLDLDIDRANWLVELALEWKNMTKSEIPDELIDKLARSLFVTEETKDFDVHPAETLFSSLFGKDGKISIRPGSVTMQRSDGKDTRDKKSGK